jgi:hypothetical protein
MSNTELREIRSAVEALGYLPIHNAPSVKKQDLWYRRSDGSSKIDSFLFLAYKPKAQAYSVHAGVVSRDARANVLASLASVKEFINPIYLADSFYIERPCWHMFDAGRALDWSSVYIIPDPYDRPNWRARFDELVNDFLAKEIFGISTEREIIDLLMRNDPPFEWSLTNPVLRVSEVVSMARASGLSIDELMLRVDVRQKDITRGLYGSKGYAELMDAVVELLY